MNDKAKMRLPKSDVVINDVSFINQTGNQVNKGSKRLSGWTKVIKNCKLKPRTKDK